MTPQQRFALSLIFSTGIGLLGCADNEEPFVEPAEEDTVIEQTAHGCPANYHPWAIRRWDTTEECLHNDAVNKFCVYDGLGIVDGVGCFFRASENALFQTGVALPPAAMNKLGWTYCSADQEQLIMDALPCPDAL